MSLSLRPVRADDEHAVLAAHAVMKHDDFCFALGLDEAPSFAEFVRGLDDCMHGRGLLPGRVPSTFLLAEVEGTIVGRLSFRHELTEFLRRVGGHIGFGVLPAHRRRGYATAMLRQGLLLARSRGLARVLVTCDDDNIGSQRVIEGCGGVHTHTVPAHAEFKDIRQYWIDLG